MNIHSSTILMNVVTRLMNVGRHVALKTHTASIRNIVWSPRYMALNNAEMEAIVRLGIPASEMVAALEQTHLNAEAFAAMNIGSAMKNYRYVLRQEAA